MAISETKVQGWKPAAYCNESRDPVHVDLWQKLRLRCKLCQSYSNFHVNSLHDLNISTTVTVMYVRRLNV